MGLRDISANSSWDLMQLDRAFIALPLWEEIRPDALCCLKDTKGGVADDVPKFGTPGGIDAKTGAAPSSIHETSISDVSNRAKQNFPCGPRQHQHWRPRPRDAQLPWRCLIWRCAPDLCKSFRCVIQLL